MLSSHSFNTDNIRSYARAGIELARAARRLAVRGYDSMVIPSRGAVPVLNIAQAYHTTIIRPAMTRDERVASISESQFGPWNKTLHIPFTADTGPMGVDDLTSGQIRRFWARTVAAIVRGQMDDPNYRLFRFVRDDVCRVGHHDGIEWQMRNERFIFLDTVVSGRAVCEIEAAFRAEGLHDVHYMLLVDENGDRLHGKYRQRLLAMEAAGDATLINLNSLFTEDQGPAVSGVWSVVFPQIMEMARTIGGFNDGIVGGGLYYFEIKKREDESNLPVTLAIAHLNMLLFQAMHAECTIDDICEDMDELGADFATGKGPEAHLELCKIQGGLLPTMVGDYLEHLSAHNLFDRRFTENIAHPRLIEGMNGRRATVDASSSHCLRLTFDPDEAAGMMKRFRRSLASPYWVDSDCTTRAPT